MDRLIGAVHLRNNMQLSANYKFEEIFMNFCKKGSLLLPCKKIECLKRLGKLVLSQTLTYNDEDHQKVLFSCYRKAWLYRAYDLYRGMFELKESRPIVALAIARPFLEHVIVFIEYMRTVKDLTDKKNYEQINNLLSSLGEKTKNKEFLKSQDSATAEQTNTKTILNRITEKDEPRSFFGKYFKKEETDNLKNQYDVLSEYIHPSSISTFHHYSNIDQDNKKIELYEHGRREPLDEFQKCLEYILVFEKAYEDSEKIFNDAIDLVKFRVIE